MLDSEFQLSLKIICHSWRNCSCLGLGKYKMNLKYLVSKASNCSKNDGKMSKGQRAWLKEVPTV